MKKIIALLCVVLSGCAGTTKFQNHPDVASGAQAATIHVVRANSAFGAALTAPVYVDRYLIGRIGPGGYLTTKVPVGRVHVTSTTGDVIVRTEPNAEYFFEVSMPVQGWLYAPDFNVVQIKKQQASAIIGN
jgi:hypothetical protein